MLAALLVPVAVCAVLVPFRTTMPNTDASLILVAAVVAIAAYGHRVAGVLASVTATTGFDFLLTAPYERLSITDRHDVETSLLLLAVGVAVTELAVRGRRSRVLALTDETYLEAIRSTSELAESRAGQAELTAHVSARLTALLGLRGCRFETNRFGGMPRLLPDGRLRADDRDWDIDQHGLPQHEIEVLASVRGRTYGRFVLDPTAGVTPPPAARTCAMIVVSQAAAVLASYRQPA